MWNKLAHLVKRNVENEPNHSDEQNRHNDRDASGGSASTNSSVISRVYGQHPNLSHFHSGSAIHLASPSPPGSPSKGSKRGLFKRSLKAKSTSTPVAQPAQGEAPSRTSPLPVNLAAKKVRTSLHVDTFSMGVSRLSSLFLLNMGCQLLSHPPQTRHHIPHPFHPMYIFQLSRSSIPIMCSILWWKYNPQVQVPFAPFFETPTRLVLDGVCVSSPGMHTVL